MTYNIDDNFIEQLKNKHYEIYLIILILGNKNYVKSIILASIFVELDNISSKVKEKMAGFVRLTWWRNAFTDFKLSGIANHPLLDNLSELSLNQYQYLEKIFEAVEADLEADDQKNIQHHIINKYSALFNLLMDSNNLIPEDLLISFFIITQILIKKSFSYLDKLGFFCKKDQISNLEYTKQLINKAVENIKNFQKDKLCQNNLFLHLLSDATLFYSDQFAKIGYDMYLFDHTKCKFKLALYLYIQSLKFWCKSKFLTR